MKKIINYLFSLSIYTKLAVLIFIMVIFISGSITLISINLSNKQIKQITKELVESNLNTNHEFITKAILEKDYWNLYKYLKALSKNSVIKEIGIIDKKGFILAYSNPKKFKSGELLENLGNHRVIDILSNDILLGKIVLIEDNKNISEIIEKTFVNSFYIMLIIGLISFIIANLFLRRIINRFKVVINNMTSISQKNWNNIKYDTAHENDELHDLILQSIKIVDEIKNSIEKENSLRVFYHNVLSSIDSLIIICDKQMNIRYHNNHILTSYILDDSKTYFNNDLFIDLAKKENFSCSLKVDNENLKYLFFNIHSIEDRILINISDITKLKEAEENDKILQSFEIVKEISSQFAHEIKNLLQPLALLIPKNKLPDKEDLPIIHLTLSKMKKQVSDYLTLGKTIDLNNDSKHLVRTILDELLIILKNRIQEKNLKIIIDVKEDFKVNFNKKYIELILMNLIVNAIEASYKNTSITILWELNKDNESLLTIKNIGENIEDTSKIFKPFFTTKKEGSGLGLFSIYKIVYTAKGKIDVLSKDNQTIFKIYLPHKE